MDNKIIKHTEKPSGYRHLENKDTGFLLYSINQEDQKVPHIIKEVIPKIIPLVDIITDKMLSGGRLFYLGAGTSGRLGIVDA
jgi:N-acetylmuramic acid 6-phosphate etherase